jgi:acyl-CoA reductase-like NAD-dependent aldehyde dehydrogenase
MDLVTTLWELDTPERAGAYLASHANPIRLQNFIENNYSEHAEPNDWIDSFNPRTGELLAQIPRSALSEVDRAVEAASRAFPTWSRTSRQERSEILLRIAAILSEKKELFAIWESIDQGKTLSRARVEVDRAISNFRYVGLFLDTVRRCQIPNWDMEY